MLKIQNLNFKYSTDNFKLQDISFSLQEGEYLGITGLNNSGKTTLLKILIGIIPEFDKGELTGALEYFDEDLTEYSLNQKAGKMGIIFQNPDHQFFFTTLEDEIIFSLENLQYPPEDIPTAVKRVLKKVNLLEYKDIDPNNLSYGQKKLALLAINIAIDPEILLLDEIFVSLDNNTKSMINEIILDLKSQGKLIINVDKDINNLKSSDKILILESGEIEYLGNSFSFFEENQYANLRNNYSWSLN